MLETYERFFIPAVKIVTPVATMENLDGQGLTMEWEVLRDNASDADMGSIRIYNLGPATAQGIHEAWRRRRPSGSFKLEISAGWDGVPKLLMSGDVWEMKPAVRDGADVITQFEIGDGIDSLRDQMVGATFAKADLATVIEFLVTLDIKAQDIGGGGLGLSYPAESKALVTQAALRTPVSRFRNLAAGLNTRARVTELMSTLGLEWRVQNGAFIAMRGRIVNRPGPILRPRNGLISYEVRNDGGISVTALANPDVEPGIQMQVQDDLEVPFGEIAYRVEAVGFSGSTKGESIMAIEAAKAVLV